MDKENESAQLHADQLADLVARVRDCPTIDEWSGGLDHEIIADRAMQAQRDIDDAEEQGMSVAEWRKFLRDEETRLAAKEAYQKTPEYREQLRKEGVERDARAAKNRSTDEAVSAVAFAAFGAVTPLALDYYGDGVCLVRQRIGGLPKRCKINTRTLEIAR